MNRTPVRIYIFPDNIELTEVENYSPRIYGNEFSDLESVKLSQVHDGHSILYRDSDFKQISVSVFADNIINLLADRFPNTNFGIEIYYFHMGEFDEDCGMKVMELDEYLYDNQTRFVAYKSSTSVNYISEHYDEDSGEFYFDSDGDNYNVDDEDDDEDDYRSEEYFGRPYYGYGYDEDEDDDYPYRDKRYRHKEYQESELMYRKSAIKNIKHHNFLVSNNNKLRKRDADIIKAFLKDFIPNTGNPSEDKWRKKYRKTLFRRWFAMFVMSKEQAKEFEKLHKKRSGGIGTILNNVNTLDVTRSILGSSTDPWGDPRR